MHSTLQNEILQKTHSIPALTLIFRALWWHPQAREASSSSASCRSTIRRAFRIVEREEARLDPTRRIVERRTIVHHTSTSRFRSARTAQHCSWSARHVSVVEISNSRATFNSLAWGAGGMACAPRFRGPAQVLPRRLSHAPIKT